MAHSSTAFVHRRAAWFAIVFALALASVVATPAMAQTYPSKPIRVINPWGAGGAADSIIRPVMLKLADVFGQPIVVENQPGASAMIGTTTVAKAAPDGYTLLFASLGPNAISPVLEPKIAYDQLKDFEPITQLVSSPLVLMVRRDLPIHSVAELVTYAKAHPGKLTYGSVGAGSTTHLAAEMLSQMANIDLLHVPYKGSAQAATDLLGGQIDLAFINIAGVLPLMNSPKVQALAVSTPRRAEALPNVPALAESFPGYDLNSWWGLMAPAGTPKEIVNRLYAETAKIMQLPDIKAGIRDAGLEVAATTPAAYAELVKTDMARWAAIIKARGIKVN